MLNGMSTFRHLLTAVLALTAAASLAASAPASAAPGIAAEAAAVRSADPALVADDWVWPVSGFRILTAYVAPAHRYGPGHRGIDLELFGVRTIRSPAAGFVQFSGRVVDRDLITIDHGNGLVTTLEPVTSPLVAGDRVARGEDVGIVGDGGHTPAGGVHFGVRWHGEYINPMVVLGGVPRAVLLPCCA
jgi:murein DD-endopeptidase MepM/ murein hydrolase activator NlpD|tara:strand:+ start:16016 stop:16579 length:564 start_codon:yes stop_codon:yes gene_type:complete